MDITPSLWNETEFKPEAKYSGIYTDLAGVATSALFILHKIRKKTSSSLEVMSLWRAQVLVKVFPGQVWPSHVILIVLRFSGTSGRNDGTTDARPWSHHWFGVVICEWAKTAGHQRGLDFDWCRRSRYRQATKIPKNYFWKSDVGLKGQKLARGGCT